MCQGIALAQCEIPESLIRRYRLEERIIRRSPKSGDEFRFLLAERTPLLPVWHENQFLMLPWGCRNRRAKVPISGWCPKESLEAGLWAHWQPEEVSIPATFGFDRGVWYQIREGLKGILVRDRAQQPHVYILTQASTHYYEVMTRNNREPVMVGETI